MADHSVKNFNTESYNPSRILVLILSDHYEITEGPEPYKWTVKSTAIKPQRINFYSVKHT